MESKTSEDALSFLDEISRQLDHASKCKFDTIVETAAADGAALRLVSSLNRLLDEARRAQAEADTAALENRHLREERSVLQHVIDTVPHSVFWKDRGSIYLGANRNTLRDLGVDAPEQLIGKTDYDTVVARGEAEFYRKADKEVMDSGRSILNMEETQLRADGPHVLLTSKVPLRNEKGAVTGILGIYIDITERKRIETELALAKEYAESCARARSEFLTNVSHEIRTPLTLILGPVEAILSSSSGELAAPLRTDLERIHRNASRLCTLVNDILDFTKLEAGKMEAHWEVVHVKDLVAELTDDARSAAGRKNIRIEYTVDAGLGLVPLDRTKFEKIVLNLLANALKFTPPNGRIDVSLQAAGDHFELSVADTGPGIPLAQQAMLFQRFQQVDVALPRRHEGTGIGLSLVKRFAELMGGTVGVQSRSGEGSRFFVRIPVSADRMAGLRLAGQDLTARSDTDLEVGHLSHLFPELLPLTGDFPRGGTCGPAATDGPTVLVVEDNADMRAYMRDVLSASYNVETVENGKEALARLENHQPAVIVSDIMMPEVDGIELVCRLKANPKLRQIPVILVTAKASREELVRGLNIGADDYLSKPFGPAELCARVRAAHRQRQTYDELEAKHRDLMRALEQLRDTQEELVQAGKLAALGTLVAGMSHELNNPIAAVQMHAESLLRRVPGDASWRTSLQAIERQARRAGQLIRLLLGFSRRKPAVTESVSIPDLIGRVVELACSQVRSNHVAVEVIPLETSLPEAEANVQELEVALLNLIKNGIDATAPGGKVSVAAHYMVRNGTNGVEISVSDTGSGIPADVLPRIFDPFFTTKPVGTGTGLGLSLTKRIVESHGGEIRAASEIGVGTTMRVWLPMTKHKGR